MNAALAAVAVAGVLDWTTGRLGVSAAGLRRRLVAPVARRKGVTGTLLAISLVLLVGGVAGVSILLVGRVTDWWPVTAGVAGVLLAGCAGIGSQLVGVRERIRQADGTGETRATALSTAARILTDRAVAPLLGFGLGSLVGLPTAVGVAASLATVTTLGVPATGSGDVVRESVVNPLTAVPARVAAVLLAAVAFDPDAPLRARQWIRGCPSPSEGWPAGTLAAALGVRLVGTGGTTFNPVGSLPDAAVAARGMQLVGRGGVGAYLLAAALTLY